MTTKSATMYADTDEGQRVRAASGGAGWTIDAAIERPFTYSVRLIKSA